MRSFILAIIATLAFSSPAFAAGFAFGGIQGDGYAVGVGGQHDGNAVSLELHRTHIADHATNYGASLNLRHDVASMSGFTAYVGAGAGYGNDRRDHCPSASGASVNGEIGLRHQVAGPVSASAYVRSTHDFVDARYQRDRTEGGLRITFVLGS